MKNLSTFFIAASSLLLSLALYTCSSQDADTSSIGGQSGSITRFAIHNGYMYTLNPNGLETYSLADPDKPQKTSTLPTDYGLETIIIYENVIYLGSRTALYILDITEPAYPVLLSKTDRIEALFNGCDPVVVKGNYAYSTIKIIENRCGSFNSSSVLITYDVTDKTAPITLDMQIMDMPNGLGYKDDFLFVCEDGFNSVEVFDISNPATPLPTDFSFPVTDPVDVIVTGEKLIVSSKTAFYFYDISDISDIRLLGSIDK